MTRASVAAAARHGGRASLSVAAWLAAAALLALPGCVINPPPAGPTHITVELVNATGLVVDANFFRSGSAADSGALFVGSNIFTGYSTSPIPTLGSNVTARFEVDCDDARSIGVRLPVFVNPVTLTGGQAPQTLFLLRDSDFRCGQRVTFTYSAVEGGFAVAVSVSD
ncbi:MAG: hypothetical protein IPM64_04940 [Phycisphaerales bacterium]|nr:hypothetical protein [Phycisphaerales bacterium]